MGIEEEKRIKVALINPIINYLSNLTLLEVEAFIKEFKLEDVVNAGIDDDSAGLQEALEDRRKAKDKIKK